MTLRSAYEVLACHCRYHPFTAKGMQAVIASIPELYVVGKAFNGIDAISLIKREQPDCALLDLSMPGANGLEVFQEAESAILFRLHRVQTYHKLSLKPSTTSMWFHCHDYQNRLTFHDLPSVVND